MRELALFAGAGGGILGGKLLGWRTVCAVELNSYCATQIIGRQNDGSLPPFPIWDDVRSFDGQPWRGLVDVVSGGFPCQDISVAGRGAGINGERSGLWSEMFRIICEAGPKFVLVENSPLLTRRGLDRVLADLASVGFNAEWRVLGADDVGAPHIRKRIWILAYSSSESRFRKSEPRQLEIQTVTCRDGAKKSMADSDGLRKQQSQRREQKIGGWTGDSREEISNPASEFGKWIGTKPDWESNGSPNCSWWETEPTLGRVVDGMAYRVDQLKAIGNGQVPRVVELAWKILSKEFQI
ncbi:DNA cytosine methyltransferase [Leptospira santarosai]|uniref:DNA cytosine methyltransferase n=1 Tax=Leptospira santarosai TaxID=28183 RepID=UPI000773B900|nr:DNA cytosine methyltransferase [Leptospira santarosai]